MLTASVCIGIVLTIMCWGTRHIGIKRISSLPSGWRLLWLSGVLFVPGGLVWLLKWQPTLGPYMVGQSYPFGDHVQAWEVSMGFAFVAFGVVFSAATVLAARIRERWALHGLLLGWFLLMFPHMLIGLTFFLDDPSLLNMGVARYAIPFSAGWFAIVVAGFALAYRSTAVGDKTASPPT